MPNTIAGRLLLLSPFEKTPRRVTADSAHRRNTLVAALADQVFIAYTDPGGELERLSARMRDWKIHHFVVDGTVVSTDLLKRIGGEASECGCSDSLKSG